MNVERYEQSDEVETALARERLTDQVLKATTLLEVLTATRVLRAWIDAHPEDEGMSDAFEQLAMMQEIAEGQAKARQNELAV
jgi:hypothetical protein